MLEIFPKKKEKYVFDDYALKSYFEGEEKASYLVSLLKQAQQGKVEIYVSVISFGEIMAQALKQSFSLEKFEEIIKNLPLVICEINLDLVTRAALLARNEEAISCEEAINLALAEEKEATLVTTNRELKLNQSKIPISWL